MVLGNCRLLYVESFLKLIGLIKKDNDQIFQSKKKYRTTKDQRTSYDYLRDNNKRTQSLNCIKQTIPKDYIEGGSQLAFKTFQDSKRSLRSVWFLVYYIQTSFFRLVTVNVRTLETNIRGNQGFAKYIFKKSQDFLKD